jgi:hypothetical protein
MLEVMKRSFWNTAYITILRCKVGDGAVAKRILMEAVVFVRAVFEGWVVCGFVFWRGGRGWMMKRS